MPFGLTNAPATFQRLMTTMLQQFIGRSVLVYIDDILIYSSDKSNHLEHVSAVLQTLKENGLYCKQTKCAFAVPQIDFCGHTIREGEVRPLTPKLESIERWPTPTTVRELRSFLGFANFYRRFIPNFSEMTATLTEKLRKDAEWFWNARDDDALQRIKDAFKRQTTLTQPDYSKMFILHVDASTQATGATLSQYNANGDLALIECMSKRLTPAQTRWPAHELELFALLRATQAWRHYLLGSKIVVHSDSILLTHLRSQPNLSDKQTRCIERLSQFNFEVRHIPGRQNVAADALSRMANPDATSLPANEIDTLHGMDDACYELEPEHAKHAIWYGHAPALHANTHLKTNPQHNQLQTNLLQQKNLFIPLVNLMTQVTSISTHTTKYTM